MILSPLVIQRRAHTFMPTGDDSVHIVGNVSASKVYLNTGGNVSLNAGLIASTIYGGAVRLCLHCPWSIYCSSH